MMKYNCNGSEEALSLRPNSMELGEKSEKQHCCLNHNASPYRSQRNVLSAFTMMNNSSFSNLVNWHNETNKTIDGEQYEDSDQFEDTANDCSKKREYIREGKAKCVVCVTTAQQSSDPQNASKDCARGRKGCKSCHVIVCKKHWKEFNIDHSKW
jgi:hypothetical protein